MHSKLLDRMAVLVKNHQTANPTAKLILEDGSVFQGTSFGYPASTAGEVVFNTGMVGYPETLTDPSYYGQILVLTYPLIGNYGVPPFEPGASQLLNDFESERVQIAGLVVSNYSREHNHWKASQSLGEWLYRNGIPAISGIDTRALTRRLREQGTMLGKILVDEQELAFYDPNAENLVEKVSPDKPRLYGKGKKRVVLIDCGTKNNIIHHLLKRNLEVWRVPWDYDLRQEQFDALLVSNGPGNPKMCRQTILQIRHAYTRRIPTFGICLGHQLMALAAGANTYKMKYGHRSQNQPVQEVGSSRCLITSQNHGYAVENKSLPRDWDAWFVNLNDGSNEGLRHQHLPVLSVQFHPEAAPGPVDAEYLFDQFARMIFR